MVSVKSFNFFHPFFSVFINQTKKYFFYFFLFFFRNSQQMKSESTTTNLNKNKWIQNTIYERLKERNRLNVY